MTSTAEPERARSTRAWRIIADGAGIDAPGRLVDDQHRRLAVKLAADDEFLQIAAGKRARFGIGLALAHIVVAAITRAATSLAAARSRKPLRTSPAVRGMAGQHDVLGQRESRNGAMTQPLLGHKGGAQLAALGHAEPAGGLAVRCMTASARLVLALARDGIEELGLAVAGNAGDGDDFAAVHLQRDILQRDGKRTVRPR